MYKTLQSLIIEKLPSVVSVPLRFIPFSQKKRVIEQLLQLQFEQALKENELDFLKNRWLKIEVLDLNLAWFVSLVDSKLQVSQDEIADVTFSGQTHDLILIATHRQDPDTLFFQRRLIVEGDTELGLHVKNIMDAIELSSMPKALRVTLEMMADIIDSTRHKQENS